MCRSKISKSYKFQLVNAFSYLFIYLFIIIKLVFRCLRATSRMCNYRPRFFFTIFRHEMDGSITKICHSFREIYIFFLKIQRLLYCSKSRAKYINLTT